LSKCWKKGYNKLVSSEETKNKSNFFYNIKLFSKKGKLSFMEIRNPWQEPNFKFKRWLTNSLVLATFA